MIKKSDVVLWTAAAVLLVTNMLPLLWPRQQKVEILEERTAELFEKIVYDLKPGGVYSIQGDSLLDARSESTVTLMAVRPGTSYIAMSDGRTLYCGVIRCGTEEPDGPAKDNIADTVVKEVGAVLAKGYRSGYCRSIAANYRKVADSDVSSLEDAVDRLRELNQKTLKLTEATDMEWAAAWHAVLTAGGPIDKIYTSAAPDSVESIKQLFRSIADGFSRLEDE